MCTFIQMMTMQNVCCRVLHFVRNEKWMVNSKKIQVSYLCLKSVRYSCVIKVFGGVFMLSRSFSDCSMGEGVFVLGLSQISSFFSYIAMHDSTLYRIWPQYCTSNVYRGWSYTSVTAVTLVTLLKLLSLSLLSHWCHCWWTSEFPRAHVAKFYGRLRLIRSV